MITVQRHFNTKVKSAALRVAHILPGDCEEAETYVINLINAIHQLGVKSEIICTSHGSSATRFSGMGLPVTVMPVKHYFDAPSLIGIGSFLEAMKANLVHSHSGLGSFIATFAAKQTGIPSVSTVHSARQEVAPIASRAITKGMRALKNRQIQHFMPVNESLATQLAQLDNIQDSKITVIHPAVDFFELSNSRRLKQRSELAISDQDFVLIATGDLDSGSGFNLLLEGMVSPAVPDYVKLLIVGNGHASGPLRKRVARAKLEARVHILEHQTSEPVITAPFGSTRTLVKRTDIASYFNAADAYVATASSSPSVAVQAMFAGLPLIGIRGTEVGEVVQENKTGMLIPPDNSESLAYAIKIMTANPKLRTDYGAAAKLRAFEQYSAKAMATSVLSVYESVLGLANSH